MKKLLIVVDMQNDFIDGTLGTEEAKKIIPNVVNKIKDWDGDIWITMDTHEETYLESKEGKHLPTIHCVKNTDGWQVNEEVRKAIDEKFENGTEVFSWQKPTFGSTSLALQLYLGENIDPEFTSEYEYIELIGLCTDICVVSNALIIKAFMPNIDIAVDASCCAGVTPESHEAALTTMKMCQVEILNA